MLQRYDFFLDYPAFCHIFMLIKHSDGLKNAVRLSTPHFIKIRLMFGQSDFFVYLCSVIA
jgi:hypothetical protein